MSIGYLFEASIPFSCRDTGKFESPSDNWQHEALPLDDTFELCVVTRGILYLKYQDVRYAIREGEFLLMEPGETPNNIRHGYNHCACDFYWLHFYPPRNIQKAELENIDFSFLDMSGQIFIPIQGVLTSPEKIAVHMRQLQDSIRSNYSFLSLNYLTTIIFCEIHNQIRTSYLSQQPNPQKALYNIITDYIHENISQPLSIHDIAAKLNYNEQYLSRLFRKYSNESLHDFIVNCKIEQSNFYLSETDLPVKIISEKLGYSDCHNFMKLYKKQTGMTPSEYRNSFPNRLRYNS